MMTSCQGEAMGFQHQHSSIWTRVLNLNWRERNSRLWSNLCARETTSHVLISLRLPGRSFLFHIVSEEFSVTSWGLLSLWQSTCLGVASLCSRISHTLYTAGTWKALNETLSHQGPLPGSVSITVWDDFVPGSDCIPLGWLSQNSRVTLVSFQFLLLLQTLYE